MTIFRINRARCSGCGLCVEACPERAIRLKEKKASILTDICQGCAICQAICKNNAIQEVETSLQPAALPVVQSFDQHDQRRLRHQPG